MNRDFTESLEQVLYDLIACDNTLDLLYDGPEYFEVIEYWESWNDMVEDMYQIELTKEQITIESGYIETDITEIFTAVREYDDTYSETIAANASTFFDAYIETLEGLIDAIRVDDNNPYTTTEMYAMSAREQYGRWGGMSSDCGGVFNNSELFSQQIQNAGAGIVQVCYESIRDVDGVGFRHLMAKPVEEIKPWEVAALSLVFEDCIGEDGYIDCERLEDLVNRCYQVPYAHRNYDPITCDVTLYVEMSLSPVMGLLNDYMTAQASYVANLYANSNTRLTYNLFLRDVQSVCYLSDVVFSLNMYYSNNCYACMDVLATWEMNSSPSDPSPEDWLNVSTGWNVSDYQPSVYEPPVYARVSLAFNDSADELTMSFEHMEDNVTIYRFTDDLSRESSSAYGDTLREQLEDEDQQLMVNVSGYILNQVAGRFIDELANCIPGVGTLNSLCGFVSDVYGIYNSYNETVENNAEIYRAMNNVELTRVLCDMGSPASIVRCGTRWDIRNGAFNNNAVICLTALYNQAVQGNYGGDNANLGLPIESYQVVEEEYYQYISGQRSLDECPSLNALITFERGETLYDGAGNYDNYYDDIGDALETYLGVDYIHADEVYSEQLLEVVDGVAVRWLENIRERAPEQNNNQ